jgi:hypothetical protein
MNMQFQLNDMAVMLASGQSPFVLMMQQGMQIGQMFGPGMTVSQALKATGAGILTFLTNPINLAITGFAVAAGAVPLLWAAFTGPEAKSAKDTLQDVKGWLDDLKRAFPEAARAARSFMEAGLSSDELTVTGRERVEELTALYEGAVEGIVGKVAEINRKLSTELSPDDMLNGFVNAVSQGEAEIAGLVNALADGQTTISRFRQELADIALADNADEEVKRLARELLLASQDAKKFAAEIDGVNAALAALEKRRLNGLETFARSPQLSMRIDPDLRDQLVEDLKRQAEAYGEVETAAMRAAARDAERAAMQRAANEQTLADIGREIAALSASGDERETLLAQLREEQEIRSAVAALGAEASEEQKRLLAEEISYRNALIAQNEAEAAATQARARANDEMARSLSSIAVQLIRGGDAGNIFARALANIGEQMLSDGFRMLLAGPGGSSGQGTSLITSFITSLLTGGSAGAPINLVPSAKGNAFDRGQVIPFARGGMFNGPTLFPLGLAGEAGPEAILPLKRGSDGRLGVASAGAGGGAGMTAIQQNINIHVSGARGNAEIREMVAAGVAEGQANSDRALPRKVRGVLASPNRR